MKFAWWWQENWDRNVLRKWNLPCNLVRKALLCAKIPKNISSKITKRSYILDLRFGRSWYISRLQKINPSYKTEHAFSCHLMMSEGMHYRIVFIASTTDVWEKKSNWNKSTKMTFLSFFFFFFFFFFETSFRLYSYLLISLYLSFTRYEVNPYIRFIQNY